MSVTVEELQRFTQYEQQEISKLEEELQKRDMESLRLYEPLPFQQKFHASRAKELILSKGNQTGGSLTGFVEDVRAVTRQDPYRKYPKNGVLVIVGMDSDHIGLVMHRYLLEPGAFKIIPDENTRKWRTYKPWLDESRKSEAVPAPPLLPNRYIKDIVWERRGAKVFSSIYLKTGWTIHAMSSKADPSQGFQASLVHIDEDLERGEWYQEMIARLLMEDGYLRWTALPHGHNDAIVNLIERAEDEQGKEEPLVECIEATIFDNPYMPEKSREARIAAWKREGEAVYRKRALGKLSTTDTLMYPSFDERLHCVPRANGRGEAYDILVKQNGEAPSDWCFYTFTDPGHAICAVLLMAVPPPNLGNYVFAVRELYMAMCDARHYGRMMKDLCRHKTIQAHIIDMHGGRLTDFGSGEMPHHAYSRALKENGVWAVETEFGYKPAVDNRKTRELALRDWLGFRPDGSIKYQILSAFCPNHVREFRRFKKKKDKSTGMVLDEPNLRSPHHLIDNAEYAAAHGCAYVAPKSSRVKKSWVKQVLEQRARMRRMAGGEPRSSYVNLGPRGAD